MSIPKQDPHPLTSAIGAIHAASKCVRLDEIFDPIARPYINFCKMRVPHVLFVCVFSLGYYFTTERLEPFLWPRNRLLGLSERTTTTVDGLFFSVVICTFFTNRGHRCDPFSNPVLAFDFLSRIGFSKPTSRRYSSTMGISHARAIAKSYKKKSLRVYTWFGVCCAEEATPGPLHAAKNDDADVYNTRRCASEPSPRGPAKSPPRAAGVEKFAILGEYTPEMKVTELPSNASRTSKRRVLGCLERS